MANERTIPALPCASIDVISEFYQALGFTVTYRQQRPNPYLALRREDFDLHFFGMPDFAPEDSYGSCLVYVPDVAQLHAEFAAGLRARYGRIPVAGIPRMTRPRKRKNSGNLSGFTVVDPGGNWIRIFPAGAEAADKQPEVSRLAQALQDAVVLGDSKGDHRQAAKILDGALARAGDATPPVDRVEALVYRAELAVRLADTTTGREMLRRVRATELTSAEQAMLADALDNAAGLQTGTELS